MACALCHRTVGTFALNLNDLPRGRELVEKLGVKWGESAAVCICKLCLAEFELTGEWTVICWVCKKGFAKVPTPCDVCGLPACEACTTRQLPPGTWEIRFNVSKDPRKMDRVSVCKNCVAEKALTED